ncbi:MAG: PmoA family protein [Planctomycetes bacterium]|nr:PmoA family protein [Planctomycetota bacterium]
MTRLAIRVRDAGFQLYDGDQLVARYRAAETLPREESPKPCFHPIYDPNARLITEYRPPDHLWHTGLYYGWVHVNEANLWGGPWYVPALGKYEWVASTHGEQRHESFKSLGTEEERTWVVEEVTLRDARDNVMAREQRRMEFQKLTGCAGTLWMLSSVISPETDSVTFGASRAARYSGLELRMGPPFADAMHRTSEGVRGHENVMKSRARWCLAAGASGGAVALLDHPRNPRHPAFWFARRNLMGVSFLMQEDLTIVRGECLELRYGFLVLGGDPGDDFIEARYAEFVGHKSV